jgi:hypothetical protein
LRCGVVGDLVALSRWKTPIEIGTVSSNKLDVIGPLFVLFQISKVDEEEEKEG